jgi:hypothetical protein
MKLKKLVMRVQAAQASRSSWRSRVPAGLKLEKLRAGITVA